MRNRIMRIFPSLVGKTIQCFMFILYKTISVKISVLIYPVQGSQDIGPYLPDSAYISGTFVIHACKHYKKRSGIYSTIVFPERYFSCIRHLSGTHLMEY